MAPPDAEAEERPYRSHLRPACHQCRRRKSRCKIEVGAAVCLMCRVHNTECVFPPLTSATPARIRKQNARKNSQPPHPPSSAPAQTQPSTSAPLPTSRPGSAVHSVDSDGTQHHSSPASSYAQTNSQAHMLLPARALPAQMSPVPSLGGPQGLPIGPVSVPAQNQASSPHELRHGLVSKPGLRKSLPDLGLASSAMPQPQSGVMAGLASGPTSGLLAGPGAAVTPPLGHEQPPKGPLTGHTNSPETSKQTSLLLEDEDGGNAHIIGPDVTRDSQVLADYLAMMHPSTGVMRVIKPQATTQGGPVIFARVKRQPLGMVMSTSPSAKKLKIVEKLLEPWNKQLLQLFFRKHNICLPMLNEESFLHQVFNAKERVSPALICCIYAQSLVYWGADPDLAKHHRPDPTFLWKLASEALFSELHQSPGISTIVALVLNVGGRPTSSMLGNQVQLGSAVSLAHSLGLNRSPMSWDIAESEKGLRMRIWWALNITDAWSSLGYGTPPHLKRSHSDVPPPSLEYLGITENSPQRDRDAIEVFMVLFSLTELLYRYLDRVYNLDRSPPAAASSGNILLSDIMHDLERWVDSLTGNCRKIIIRGTELDTPGAANLRLSYLSLRLLTQRIELLGDRGEPECGDPAGRAPSTSVPATATSAPATSALQQGPDGDARNRYIASRRTAEDIVLFAQELSAAHFSDFWQPVSTFIFASTVTFLLRCALEIDAPATSVGASLSQSSSLRMAQDLLKALRHHQENYEWDLAELPLAQHTEVIEKLMNSHKPAPGGAEGMVDDELVVHFGAGAFDWPNIFPESSFFNSFMPAGNWDQMFTDPSYGVEMGPR
ncbi:hypothetical protein Cpir12675_004654 [Ceratocystis pirilliformis]|uniref:Zn(2)-C6 fungal-type domain-containing protein n=1 Tax=Ceratocystis pirilliformis TaxID=259994 RepID=A0ABR3YUU0_9PEZI